MSLALVLASRLLQRRGGVPPLERREIRRWHNLQFCRRGMWVVEARGVGRISKSPTTTLLEGMPTDIRQRC